METPVNSETLIALKQIVIATTNLKISPDQMKDDANLFDDCGLDSTSVVDLVLSLEEKFDITIGEDELETELFQKISTLARFVDSKLSARPASRGSSAT